MTQTLLERGGCLGGWFVLYGNYKARVRCIPESPSVSLWSGANSTTAQGAVLVKRDRPGVGFQELSRLRTTDETDEVTIPRIYRTYSMLVVDQGGSILACVTRNIELR